MKFPGFRSHGYTPLPTEEPAPPVLVARPTIDMGALRNRLVIANTGAPDDLTPMANYAAELVDRYQGTQDATERLLILAHLYFGTAASMRALDREQVPVELRRFGRSNAMNPTQMLQARLNSRRTVLRELFAAVAGKLADCFKTSVNALPTHLDGLFAKRISNHGIEMDEAHFRHDLSYGTSSLAYVDDATRARYRVTIRSGRAFVLDRSTTVAQEVPLDTTRDGDYAGKHRTGAWGFVLSMSRELYVAHHKQAAKDCGAGEFYHSSYFRGMNVLSAGDCIFEDGWLRSVTNLSGHYKPHDRTLVHFLELFKMHGTDLSKVLVGAVGYAEGERKSLMDRWSNHHVFALEGLSAGAFMATERDWGSTGQPRKRRDNVRTFQKYVNENFRG